MTDERRTRRVDPAPASAMRESYSGRDNPAFDAQLAHRTATIQADFFLPHLRPGMQLLDCGCGPGAISIGLAEAVAPGDVVGIDIRPEQVASAQGRAAQGGIGNVRFEVADIYALPFPDASFDAVFVHALLVHLREPLAALAEVRRVLRPGGIVGIREGDLGTRVSSPPLPLVDELLTLQVRLLQHNGGSPYAARHLRQLLGDAGFARSEASATVVSSGSLAATRRQAATLLAMFKAQDVAGTALAQGWVTPTRLEAMRAAVQSWGERPDAFSAITLCAALGWVGE